MTLLRRLIGPIALPPVQIPYAAVAVDDETVTPPLEFPGQKASNGLGHRPTETTCGAGQAAGRRQPAT
jgi:hypothetical protein